MANPDIYIPSPQDIAQGCDDYRTVAGTGEVIKDNFAKALADSRLLEVAVDQGLHDTPNPEAEGEVWQLHDEQAKLGNIALSQCVDCPLFAVCPGVTGLQNIAGGEPTPYEQERRTKQEEVAKAVTAGVSGSVVKGGFALIKHGLKRTTGDLDFDVVAPLSPSDKKTVKRVVREAGGNSFAKKSTDTTTRYAIPLKDGNQEKPIKVEFRTTENPKDINQATTIIDGMRVYKPEVILDQKISATLGRAKSRDIVDLSYLLHEFPELISGIPAESLEAVSLKLRPENSDGMRNLNMDLVGQLSAKGEGIPAWINDKVAQQMVEQLSSKIDGEIAARMKSVAQADL